MIINIYKIKVKFYTIYYTTHKQVPSCALSIPNTLKAKSVFGLNSCVSTIEL
ncbi:protein of unknown function [Pseudodesulfovibrio piezophilus C1TLV30]|uniref:Uncharacterized protein n=1 Tax=Pseudodesulfovibrio piezophilus (strain DSM 21447 / JCM 15486 / C1TLV30) TaxID=1322246 RepID=M1WQS9_PSEP2|nr:protein of unknown function [Pseudodesulfovibrio piezophilus C1TLV30]